MYTFSGPNHEEVKKLWQMFAAAVKISLKFQFFTFFHFWQCHLEAKNSRNLKTKSDREKNAGFDLV